MTARDRVTLAVAGLIVTAAIVSTIASFVGAIVRHSGSLAALGAVGGLALLMAWQDFRIYHLTVRVAQLEHYSGGRAQPAPTDTERT